MISMEVEGPEGQPCPQLEMKWGEVLEARKTLIV